MARIFKVREIGYGGAPSTYSITIGKRDLPLLVKISGSSDEPYLSIDRVTCEATRRNNMVFIKVTGIEKLTRYNKNKQKTRIQKDVKLDGILKWYKHDRDAWVPGLLSTICEKTIENQ